MNHRGPLGRVVRVDPLAPADVERAGAGQWNDPTVEVAVQPPPRPEETPGAGVALVDEGLEPEGGGGTQPPSDAEPELHATPQAESGVSDFVMPPKLGFVARVESGPFAGRPLLSDKSASALEVPPRPVVSPPGGYRPEVAAESFGVGGLWVAAASVRGYLHQSLHPPTVRQDSFALGVTQDGSHVVATVADGVSEGDLSHIVADRAAEVARREVLAALPGSVDWPAVTSAARAAVRAALLSMWRRSSPDESEPSDEVLAPYASTTLSVLVVATDVVDGLREVVSARLAGDGNAYLRDPHRGWQRLHGGKVGDVQLNRVTPLPRDPGEPDVVVTGIRHGQAAAVATDGISDGLHDGSRRVSAHLFESWAAPLATAEYLRSVSYIYLPSDDDRTGVTVWST